MNYRRGDLVEVSHAGKTVRAVVLIVTKCGTPGAVQFDGALGSVSSGLYLGVLPIMTEEDGTLTDLVHGLPVEIRPCQK